MRLAVPHGHVEIHDDSPLVIVHPLDLHPLEPSGERDPAGQIQHLAQRHGPGHLIDRRPLDVPGNPNHRPDQRDEDRIAILQTDILALVASQEKIVQIQRHRLLAAPRQPDLPQRSVLGRPPGGEKRVDGGRERADGVRPGRRGLADHEHLDRPQPVHGDGHLEVRELAGQLVLEIALHLAELHPPDPQGPHLRQDDLPAAIHLQRMLGIDAAPQGQRETVAGTDHVVRPHGNIVDGSERRRSLAKDAHTRTA